MRRASYALGGRLTRTDRLVLHGQVERRHEANGLLTYPGAAALVHRGVDRSVALACPDGCGEQLTINLDPRAGRAWRLYRAGNSVSLFPSVWRDTGCESHFIVWRSKIYWCDWQDTLDDADPDVAQKTLEAMPERFVSYVELAQQLGLIPWAALVACQQLCREGLAKAGSGDQQGQFRRLPRRS
jgi:hypothetical protein